MATPHAFVTGNGDQPRALVVIFLRGAADGLSLVPPIEDDHYYRARPRLAIAKKDAVALSGVFGLHPLLAPLRKAYSDGQLAVVHNAGSEDDTRSHFEAQDLMEHGGVAAGGWLGRFLRYRPTPASGPLSAIALGATLPECLRGAPSATVLQSLDEFSLGPGMAPLAGELRRLYALRADSLSGPARDTLSALDRIERLRGVPYHPEHGAVYPDTPFPQSLRQVARLIKARVGLEAASVDLGGWDSHFTQGTLIDPLIRQLGEGLAAFYADLGPGIATTSVVVMTEFGRRVQENSSFGTDHGRGGVMFVLGGGVRGGRVAGAWPGLTEGVLEGPGDVPVLYNYRNVLAPILQRHAPDTSLGRVFPDFAIQPFSLSDGLPLSKGRLNRQAQLGR